MVTKTGLFPPTQMIYKGKTTRSLPKGASFLDGFNVYRKLKEQLREVYSAHKGNHCALYRVKTERTRTEYRSKRSLYF